eukprot:351129-Chlamydomonas_euryale.AAC.1
MLNDCCDGCGWLAAAAATCLPRVGRQEHITDATPPTIILCGPWLPLHGNDGKLCMAMVAPSAWQRWLPLHGRGGNPPHGNGGNFDNQPQSTPRRGAHPHLRLVSVPEHQRVAQRTRQQRRIQATACSATAAGSAAPVVAARTAAAEASSTGWPARAGRRGGRVVTVHTHRLLRRLRAVDSNIPKRNVPRRPDRPPHRHRPQAARQ